MKALLSVVVLVTGAAGSAHAVNFDELFDGDLSDDRANPTAFTLEEGSNVFRMDVFDSNDFVNGDIDYMTVTIPAGLRLDGIILNEASTPPPGFDAVAFIGLGVGDEILVDPVFPDPGFLTGFVLTTSDLVGTNILPTMNNFDSSPIVGEAVRSLWIQQTGIDVTQLELEFLVSVPAPGAAGLGAVAGLALVRRRR